MLGLDVPGRTGGRAAAPEIPTAGQEDRSHRLLGMPADGHLGAEARWTGAVRPKTDRCAKGPIAI